MRAAALTLGLIFPLPESVCDGISHARWMKMRRRSPATKATLCAALLSVCASVAHAQRGWEARVTAAPNPLPAGKCAAVLVEPVDDHGYRRTTLSNGEQIDRRKFTYASGDAAHFTVRNDPSMWGSVCADPSTPSMSTIVTVTLPDGLRGTVKIFVIANGAPFTPAVVYRKQAPLRLPTSPEYAPGFVAVQTSGTTPAKPANGNAGAASAAGAVGTAPGADPTTDPNAVGTAPGPDPTTDPNAVGTAPGADPTTDPNAVGTAPGADPTTDPNAVGTAPAADPTTDPGAVGAVGTAGAAKTTPAVAKPITPPTGTSSANPKTLPTLRRGTSAKVSAGAPSRTGSNASAVDTVKSPVQVTPKPITSQTPPAGTVPPTQ
jgi:hypothetical protein